MTLRNQRIVILGGSSGIGLATAQAAAQEGANVVIVSSNKDRIAAALASLPAGAEGHVSNVSNENTMRVLFESIGEFDHLAFTAGEHLQLGSLANTAIDAARHFFEVRYWGALCAAKYGSPKIRKGGSIVFTSGIAGLRPHSNWTIPASICGAMEGLTRALALELAPIRVNVVSPGVVRTDLLSKMAEADRGALYLHTAERLPVGHVGEATDVAQAYLYLMRQSYGTGQVLVVDGGAVLV
jgi:NAD(P)-dependent dehydrogenase (short-subunit alcohol dehydrogenase family)